MKKNLLLFALLFMTRALFAQDKCTQVIAILDKVNNACQAYPPQEYCNVFVGQAISDMFGIDDFKQNGSATGFYDANTIVTNLFTIWSDKWENLGTGDSQDALGKAQDAANSNRCVIAVWQNPTSGAPGHLALILPGQLSASTSWGLNVPNAANFAMNAPSLNFVCDKLSRGFGADKMGSVILFVHKD